MLEKWPRTGKCRKKSVFEVDRVQSTFRHKVVPIQSFIMIQEWNDLRQFEANCRENARTSTRHIPECGRKAKNSWFGGYFSNISAETRIESFGSFNLVLEWILVL